MNDCDCTSELQASLKLVVSICLRRLCILELSVKFVQISFALLWRLSTHNVINYCFLLQCPFSVVFTDSHTVLA